MFGGCVKNNKAPVWLEINKWTLENNPLSTNQPGFLNHNFSDVWVYVDNKLVGVFEVPCKIPVLQWGDAKSIRLYPTIRNNGISSTKKIYPFCEAYEQFSDLVAGSTITINPKTRYGSACNFWLEDFESSTAKFITDTDASNATMVYGSDPNIALSGTYGYIALTSSDSLWVGVSNAPIVLPKSGAEVYLEVDYRNTAPILQGLTGISSDGTATDNPFIQLNAQTSDLKWKKIYLDLKEIVSYSANAVSFKPYLRALIQESTGSADVYIDNIRLVYF